MTSIIQKGLTSPLTFGENVKPTAKKNESYIKRMPAKILKCYMCDKTFPTFADVVTHLKFIHNACASSDCSKITNFKMHSPSCINRGFGCSICNKRFSDKIMLFAHFYNHIGVAFYACEICREGFQQRKDLQTHLLLSHNKNALIPFSPVHSKVVYQKCDHCSKYFKLFAEFQEHLALCNVSHSYACIVCHVIFASESNLDFHTAVEHEDKNALRSNMALKSGKRYFCGLCYLGFTKGDIAKRHLATHLKETSFICDVCQLNFNNDNELQDHYLQHIEEHYVLHDVISHYSCNSCQKTFKTQNELKEHLKNCENSSNPGNSLSKTNFEGLLISESDKENAGADSNALEKHSDFNIDISEFPIYALKSGEGLLNCNDKECIVIMDLTSLFVVQKGVCASESRMPDVKNSEAYSENDVIDAAVLQNHLFEILRPVEENTPADSENSLQLPGNIEAECVDQNSTLDSKDLETVAVSYDSNDNSIKYVVEGNLDSLPAEYRVEFLNSDSTNEGAEFVTYTNVEFLNNIEDSSVETMNNQESKLSSVVQDMECDMSVEFIENNKTVPDVMDCNDELSESDLYICNICKQVFSSRMSLCNHMASTHTGFDCYECGSSFNSEEDLKKHERNEHQNAYQCNLCDVVYPKEDLLERHKFSAHGCKKYVCNICKSSYVKKNEYDVHMMLHQGKTPPTKCEICGKIYATVSNYVRHKATHSEKSTVKKHTCNVCEKVFSGSAELQVHLKTHFRK